MDKLELNPLFLIGAGIGFVLLRGLGATSTETEKDDELEWDKVREVTLEELHKVTLEAEEQRKRATEMEALKRELESLKELPTQLTEIKTMLEQLKVGK